MKKTLKRNKNNKNNKNKNKISRKNNACNTFDIKSSLSGGLSYAS